MGLAKLSKIKFEKCVRTEIRIFFKNFIIKVWTIRSKTFELKKCCLVVSVFRSKVLKMFDTFKFGQNVKLWCRPVVAQSFQPNFCDLFWPNWHLSRVFYARSGSTFRACQRKLWPEKSDLLRVYVGGGEHAQLLVCKWWSNPDPSILWFGPSKK